MGVAGASRPWVRKRAGELLEGIAGVADVLRAVAYLGVRRVQHGRSALGDPAVMPLLGGPRCDAGHAADQQCEIACGAVDAGAPDQEIRQLWTELKREPPTCGTCDGDWAFSARRHGGKPRSFGAEANDQE